MHQAQQLDQSPFSPSFPPPSFASEPFGRTPISTLPRAGINRCLWQKRRFWAALAAVSLVLAMLVIARYRGRQTHIMIINAGSLPLPPLTITAAGHTLRLPPLDGEASRRWVLPAGGGESPVVILATPTTGPEWKWEGSLIQPESASRLILHIWGDGTVEESTTHSFWLELPGE